MNEIEMKSAGGTTVKVAPDMQKEMEKRGFKVKEAKQVKPVLNTKEVKQDGKV